MLNLQRAHIAPWEGTLLQDINLRIAPGEIHGIIGPNGAGKSTLLKVIAGELPLHSGALEIEGRPLQQWPRRELARKMAVLPQQSSLNFPFRVEQVVAMGRIPHSSGAAVDARLVAEVLTAVDIEPLAQKLYTRLSGGEKQRVQLARVLAQLWQSDSVGSGLLLLDEPTAALDLAHQQQLLDLLQGLAGSGMAIALVLHDFNLLASISDRVTVLTDGGVHSQGSPSEVLNAAMFRQVFGAEVSLGQHPRTRQPMVMPL